MLTNTITSVNISSGFCFESQNRTYFAYSNSDQQHYNVNVYDFTTQNHLVYPRPVSPYDCSATPHKDCPQLLFLENQYLVIRDAICNLILDTTMNFSLLINTSSGIADILAILHSNAHTSEKTTSPGITSGLISFRSPDHTNSVIFTPLITSSTVDIGPGISHSESPTVITLISQFSRVHIHPMHTSVPLSTAFATPISTVNNPTVTTYTDAPTSITVRNKSVGIILTAVIGLIVIIIILVTVAVGFSIQHCRRKKW